MADLCLVPVPVRMSNRETASGTCGELFIRLVDPLDAISMPLSISPLLICHDIKAEFDYFRKRVRNHGLRKVKACSLLRLAKERFNAASNMPFDLFSLWAYQSLHRDDAPSTGAEIFHELLTWCDAFEGPDAQTNTDRLLEVSDLLGCRYTSVMLAFGLYTGYRANSESVHILNCIYSFVILQGNISHELLCELNFLERAIFMAGTFRSIRASCGGFSSSGMFPSAIEVALAVESCVQQSAIMNQASSPALSQFSSSLPCFLSAQPAQPAQSAQSARLLSVLRFSKKRSSPLKNKRVGCPCSQTHSNKSRRRCQSTPPFPTRESGADVMAPGEPKPPVAFPLVQQLSQQSGSRATDCETNSGTTKTKHTQDTQNSYNTLNTSNTPNTSKTPNTQTHNAGSSSQQPVAGSSFPNRRPRSLPKQNHRLSSDSSSDEEEDRHLAPKRPASGRSSSSSESDSEEGSSDGDGPPAAKRRRSSGEQITYSRRAPRNPGHRQRQGHHHRQRQVPQFPAPAPWQLAPPAIPYREATDLLVEENVLQEQFLSFVSNFHGNVSGSGVRLLSCLVERHQGLVQRRQWQEEQQSRRMYYRAAVADVNSRSEPQYDHTPTGISVRGRKGGSGAAGTCARTPGHHIPPAQPQGCCAVTSGNPRPLHFQGTREGPYCRQHGQHHRVGHAHAGGQHVPSLQNHQHPNQHHQAHVGQHHQSQQPQQPQGQNQHRHHHPQARRVYHHYEYQPRSHSQAQGHRTDRNHLVGPPSASHAAQHSMQSMHGHIHAHVSVQRPQNGVQAVAPSTTPLIAPQPRPLPVRLDEVRIAGGHAPLTTSQGAGNNAASARQAVEGLQTLPVDISQGGPRRDDYQASYEQDKSHDESIKDEDMDETDNEDGQALA